MEGRGPYSLQAVRRWSAALAEDKSLRDLLTAQGLPVVTQAAVGFFTAAWLSPSGKGLASLGVTVASLMGACLFMSLHVGVVDAATKGDSTAVWRASAVAVGLGAIAVLLGVGLGLAGVGTQTSERQHVIFVAVLAGLIDSVFLIASRTIQGLGGSRRYKTSAAIRILTYGVLVVVQGPTRLTPLGVVLALLAADVAAAAYSLRAVKQLMGNYVQPSRRRLPIFKRSLAAHVAVITQQATYRTDIVLLGMLSSAYNLGQYAVATALAELLWIVSEALSLSVYAALSGGRRDLNEPSNDYTLRTALKMNLVLCIAGAAAVAGVSHFLMTFWLQAYSPAVDLTYILLPGVVCGGLGRILTSYFVAIDRRDVLRRVALLNLALLGVYVPLIIRDGAKGAAVASDVIYVLVSMALWVGVVRPGRGCEVAA